MRGNKVPAHSLFLPATQGEPFDSSYSWFPCKVLFEKENISQLKNINERKKRTTIWIQYSRHSNKNAAFSVLTSGIYLYFVCQLYI